MPKPMPHPPEDAGRKAAHWARYSQVGIQLLVTIGLMGGLGYWADYEMENAIPWFTILGAVVGIAVGLYNVVKGVMGGK